MLQLTPYRLAFIALINSVIVVPAFAQSTWTGATGNYVDAANWSTAAAPSAGDDAFINNGGTAVMNSGDTGNAFFLTVGETSGTSGNFEMTGGQFDADRAVFGSTGDGTATISGGTFAAASGSLFVGWEPGGTGELNVSGASTIVTSGDDVIFGREGEGTFNFSGGTLKGGFTVIGKFGTGVWNQTGGVFDQDFGSLEIGDGGRPDQASTPGPRTGTLNLSGGVMQIADDFALGNRSGQGTANISGGILSATGSAGSNIYVGLGMDWGPGGGGPVEMRVTGSQSTIVANGGFNMNVDDVATSSTLVAEITGPLHSTIRVHGDMNILNGDLVVELDGYTPVSGDQYVLIEAGADITNDIAEIDTFVANGGYDPLEHADISIDPPGVRFGEFNSVDFTLAPLPSGLSWETSYTANQVVLTVVGAAGLACDFDANSQCDAADLDMLYGQFGAAGGVFDQDGSGTVDGGDITAWLAAASDPSNPYLGGTKTFQLGDVNLDGSVNSADLGVLLNNFDNTSGLLFGAGNLNDDANVNSVDLGNLLNNFNFASASAASVPEPDGLALLLVVMMGMLAGLRRRFP